MNPRNRAVAAVIAGILVLAVIAALVVAVTASDDDQPTPSTLPPPSTVAATTTIPDTTVPETTVTATEEAADNQQSSVLQVLVTNDDGVGAAGIDALVEALVDQEGVEVTVVAPADNQSGTSDSLTSGPLTASETSTASGYPAIAVDGTPGDSIVWAIDQEGIDFVPHLVLSGSNEGQNLGPLAATSGTVGAARTASRRGIPALAVSQGLGEPPDFAASVQPAAAWVEEHRSELLAGTADPAMVTKIDAPTCTAGMVKGVVEVPLATDFADRNVFVPIDCTVDTPDPADDVAAFLGGYAPLTTFDADLSELRPAA